MWIELSALIGFLVLAATWYSRYLTQRWQKQPLATGRRVSIGELHLYASLQGQGPLTVVIETALGSSSAEWWALQTQLTRFGQVLTYDRAGYGFSDPPRTPRTPLNIAQELLALLKALDIRGPLLLVGHSQGGLYVSQLARLIPQQVAGVLLLDPLSPWDYRFKEVLEPKVYQGSGVDKTATLGLVATLAQGGWLRWLKPLLRRSPPFYYYRGLSAHTLEVIWQHLQRPDSYRTALQEYRLSRSDQMPQQLERSGGFPPVPLSVFYHQPQKLVDEMVKYGGLSPQQAWQVEALWQQLVRGYLDFTPNAHWRTLPNSGHFIHMDAPQQVLNEVERLVHLHLALASGSQGFAKV